MTVSVASGKGGAGKTSISAAIAELLAPDCVYADCDVDAANGAIALGASIREREPYNAGPGFRIDADRCVGCGLCAEACRFHAIRHGMTEYSIAAELCERCGACLDRCPVGAIVTYEKRAGELFVSDTRLGIPLIHAELIPGEDTSGKLVRKVRERAERITGEGAVLIVDSPPGIGCPVIASLSGSDLVIIAIEASASGIRDAERLIELVATMKRKVVILINKTGLDPLMDARARNMAGQAGIPIAGEIPFAPELRSLEETGETWLSADCVAQKRVASALRAVKGILYTMKRAKGAQEDRT